MFIDLDIGTLFRFVCLENGKGSFVSEKLPFVLRT